MRIRVVLSGRAILLSAFVASLPVAASRDARAQAAPVVETVVPFDSAGRLTVITPTIASRLGLLPPAWPVAVAYREARLFLSSRDGHVIAAVQDGGAVVRYLLDDAAFAALQQAVNGAITARGSTSQRALGSGTSLEVSQPAGNTFIRNQTFLGLAAYGPATAALLSESSGPVAGGGYFLAAGTSFFAAANIVRNKTVTRAQAARAAHGGTRGALMGVGLAAMYNADGGPAWGAPILVGAVAGTVAGYRHARGLSDGEAASAGLFADLSALTTLGVAGSTGVFNSRTVERFLNPEFPQYGTYRETDNRLHGAGKAAMGVALGAHMVGYALGPRYARRAAYNVTAGDVSVVFTSALLGGVTTSGFIGESGKPPARFAAATAGVLFGAWAADRGLVRRADRTTADGTLVQLGALAGALMGAGVAALAETEGQGVAMLAGAGGTLGLLAADNIVRPARDAGPLRGIMQSAAGGLGNRVQLHLGPVSTLRIAF